MGWKGLERNKLDFILTDLLPVELSELFSFRSFYDFLHEKQQQTVLLGLVEEFRKIIAKGDKIIFKKGWATMPLKYNILKGSGSTREMSIIQPFSTINLFLFLECYQKDILNFFEAKHCFSIRYHKKNTALYYKSKANKATEYFQPYSIRIGKGLVQQAGNYFRITKFESINSFTDSRIWRLSNFKYEYFATIDYKSCFDSIYTHVYKWIIERNVIDSKKVENPNLLIVIDRILQNINGLSSNGLIVGPEFSRMIAEILLQQIDSDVLLALCNDGLKQDKDYAVFRYVDDIYIFANAQENIDKIIGKFKLVGEKYLLHLNELKISRGETPCVPKAWLEKTRRISDVINNFFYQGKKKDFDELPEDKRFLVKSDYISIDRIKGEITVIMKEYPDDKKTIVSFLLSTLLNNISKKKDGYTLFDDKRAGKALLLIDMAFFIYVFYPSFEQTRKLISMAAYMNDEIDFKSDDKIKQKLNDVVNRYSFFFQQGNVFDLCDWLPFFNEYGISLIVEAENALIRKVQDANDPIIWANLLLYSQYYKPFMKDIETRLNKVIEEQISKITGNDIMLHKEFWYILIFHNCPHIPLALQNNMSNIINNLLSAVMPNASINPSSMATKLVCEYLQRQSPRGTKPEESFFNWSNVRDISTQIAFRTYQRTIFKRYRKNKHSLYASID